MPPDNDTPGLLPRGTDRWQPVVVNPASGSDSYALVTVRALLCTLALLAVLVLLLAAACIPASWPACQALNWAELP
jgi:hypothetical protein